MKGTYTQIYHRQLLKRDLEHVQTIDRKYRQRCSDINHYAMLILSDGDNPLERYQTGKFTYLYSVGFKA